MFFIEWRPDLYGEEISDKEVLNSRGFVAISSDQQQCDTERNNKPKLPCSPLVRQLSKSRVFKDWEVRLTQNIRVLELLILTRRILMIYKSTVKSQIVGDSLTVQICIFNLVLELPDTGYGPPNKILLLCWFRSQM